MIKPGVVQRQVQPCNQKRNTRVQFFLQHLWSLIAENIAQNPTKNTGNDTRHNDHRQIVIQSQRNITANDGESHQPHSIQNQEQLLQAMHKTRDHHGH